MFCLLWQISTYLYAISLRALLATDAISLFATNVACAYLLSWVILHEQFVGVRVSVGWRALPHTLYIYTVLIRCALRANKQTTAGHYEEYFFMGLRYYVYATEYFYAWQQTHNQYIMKT